MILIAYLRKYAAYLGCWEMSLQENTLFDLDLGVKVILNVTQYPQHHVTYAQANFEVATSKSL